MRMTVLMADSTSFYISKTIKLPRKGTKRNEEERNSLSSILNKRLPCGQKRSLLTTTKLKGSVFIWPIKREIKDARFITGGHNLHSIRYAVDTVLKADSEG